MRPYVVKYLIPKNLKVFTSCDLVVCVQTPSSLRKNRRRGVCDSTSLILYGGRTFPEGRGVCTQAILTFPRRKNENEAKKLLQKFEYVSFI